MYMQHTHTHTRTHTHINTVCTHTPAHRFVSWQQRHMLSAQLFTSSCTLQNEHSHMVSKWTLLLHPPFLRLACNKTNGFPAHEAWTILTAALLSINTDADLLHNENLQYLWNYFKMPSLLCVIQRLATPRYGYNACYIQWRFKICWKLSFLQV